MSGFDTTELLLGLFFSAALGGFYGFFFGMMQGHSPWKSYGSGAFFGMIIGIVVMLFSGILTV